MDRRKVLGAVGALALAVVMGVGADAVEKSKAAKAARECCCGDSLLQRKHLLLWLPTAVICCGDACSYDASTGTGRPPNVKAARSSCCPVIAAKTARS